MAARTQHLQESRFFEQCVFYVLLSPTESRHSVIESKIEMPNIRNCLII